MLFAAPPAPKIPILKLDKLISGKSSLKLSTNPPPSVLSP